jgi:hypothetical protein
MNNAYKVNLAQQFQSMEPGAQVNFSFNELKFDTPVADIQEENVHEITSTPNIKSQSDVKTASPASTHDTQKDMHMNYWVFGILSILFIIVIAVIIIKIIKRRNRT